MDLISLNSGQMTSMPPELTPLLQTSTPYQRKGIWAPMYDATSPQVSNLTIWSQGRDLTTTPLRVRLGYINVPFLKQHESYLGMDFIILNRSQMTRTTPDPAPPNFRATPMGGRLATTYHLACNKPHTRRIFSGIGFRTRDLTTGTPRPRPLREQRILTKTLEIHVLFLLDINFFPHYSLDYIQFGKYVRNLEYL
ncbi:hypothetical protein AVEN_258893-1 [Araneus ventricosus]|uniref:Uncharacterized protein n=1 Tax=Araneus ventricosus TaxID=182803 RepID=A0A4Y2EUL9_ARAVE|nr:hypothetical protein AVEN_258893-1 [Araneus ventricosus]